LNCKHHPDYDPASGEPTDSEWHPLDSTGYVVPSKCPYCWQARAKCVTEKMRLSNLAASSLETENKQLQECIKELEGQLAEAEDNLCKAAKIFNIALDKQEKREAVLRVALDKAQDFITDKCHGGDELGWLSMKPEDVSRVWQIIETALEEE